VVTDPVVIKPRVPALSRAGRNLAVAAIPWFFASLLVLYATGLAGPNAPQAVRMLSVFVTVAPIGVFFCHQWLGRVAGFRWLHHRTQPQLVLGSGGLELQLPGSGRRRFSWDEVVGLRTRPDRAADLLGRDGVALAKVPENMLLAGGTRWHSESIASAVVRMRPDRYRLSGANWAGVPNEFALRAAHEAISEANPWSRRQRLTTVGIVTAFVAVTGVILLWYLLSGEPWMGR